MNITDYINKDIKSIQEDSLAYDVLQLMIDTKLSHIPVTKDGKLIGNLRFESIAEVKKDSLEKISDFIPDLEKFQLFNNATLFDSVPVFSVYDTNIIPIIDSKELFLGTVLSEDIITEFSTYSFITEPGAYMLLTTPIKNYSISEIANIVESNNGKILGLMVTKIHEDNTYIALKINAENLSSIGETFERYNYQVKNKFFEDTKTKLLKERFQQLQKFMEV